MAGNTHRTRLCHFIRARLLSTFNFLSIRFNTDDACILLNSCFEHTAYITRHCHQMDEYKWMKPLYRTSNDQITAEEKYQEQVFFVSLRQLTEYKAYINQLNLKTHMQINLQKYVDQIPLIVTYKHFHTELYNPMHSSLPLNILRHVLNSTDFLLITSSIYDLSQFYLLLHQTYSLLIERDDFMSTSLQQLYEHGQEYYRNTEFLLHGDRNSHHMLIIENGIKVVNLYHKFTDGLIRPGACDQTQYFQPITIDTPIHYLVTTDNHDESNIIMRILRYDLNDT
jgi:hypothetical protein